MKRELLTTLNGIGSPNDYREDFRKEISIAFRIAMLGMLLAWSFGLLGLTSYSLTKKFVIASYADWVGWAAAAIYAPLLLLFARKDWVAKLSLLGFASLAAVMVAVLDHYKLINIPSDARIASVICLSALLSLSIFCYRAGFGRDRIVREVSIDQLKVFGLILLFVTYGVGILYFTAAVRPITFDPVLYLFDQTLGFQLSVMLSKFAEQNAWFYWPIKVAYIILPLFFAVQYMQQRQSVRPPRVYLLPLWLGSTMLVCLLAYLLLPVTGPKYAFGAAFPNHMPPISQIPAVAAVNPHFFARNGFPSMHFGWAFALFLNAKLVSGKWSSRFFLLFAGLTILATLGLGEHYVVDLVASVPFVYVLQGLFIRHMPWSNRARLQNIAIGVGFWLGLLLLLRFGINLFTHVPGLSWVVLLATIIVPTIFYRRMINEQDGYLLQLSPEKLGSGIEAEKPKDDKLLKVVTLLFVMSGFAGLMYEVVFSKSLALIFGSMSVAVYTVLAIYMGGMALGAWLGGEFAERCRKPLLWYAGCELLVGLYCIATPFIFDLIQGVYVNWAVGLPPDASVLVFYRVVLGGGVLLFPTVLMGMTLPLLLSYCRAAKLPLGNSVATLYGANTIGAAFGALLAGYCIIPVVGVDGTIGLAAALNLLVALLALQFTQKKTTNVTDELNRTQDHEYDVTSINTVSALSAIVILTVGGVITFALEVVYMHQLAIVAGNSTYAFSLMLFTFLLGLAIGARVARAILVHRNRLMELLIAQELLLAIVILLGVYGWESMAGYFSDFTGYPSVRTFGAREFIRGSICFLAMFPPALLIGSIYPVAMQLIVSYFKKNEVRVVGIVGGLNTLGNIAGVLIAGFVLIPAFGALRSVQLIASVAIIIALVSGLLSLASVTHRWGVVVASGLLAGLIFLQPASFNYTALASGANVYFSRTAWGMVIDHAESIDGGLTAIAVQGQGGTSVKTLLTNGKFQGNDSHKGEMQAQIGFALAPLLHTPVRDRALVIGYGSGVTSRVLHDADFKSLDIVDTSKDIVQLANKHFSEQNGKVSESEGVDTYFTDGRNYLLLTDKMYDLIGLEITSIWFSGAASLYNQEFYRLAKNKLKPDGVLQQWVQLHHMQPIDLLSVISSLRSEFKYVWIYEIGGQGMLIASNSRSRMPSPINQMQLLQEPRLIALLTEYGVSVKALDGKLLLSPQGVDNFISGFGSPAEEFISTDNNLFLEYSTPKGNVLDGQESFKRNIDLLKKAA
ncbi:fused MFS/spermidine synthase [Jeongeupia chitinilytica]|uniref:Inositolphosphotransferase Aur1/Ipt1 domain-containing protein n=1 Tax=Jeongeupia chitinilytica TaxID=1041641 RepID=A0ABQ3H0C4_9NEIS|nr:fused MFS/spermidine synthase [Jeongeupia chitinilytica]GHD64170.1 hypothetical protein GCM10007350_22630 [Jeongeupia chitinilytica]